MEEGGGGNGQILKRSEKLFFWLMREVEVD
jgi:hypothetical protein